MTKNDDQLTGAVRIRRDQRSFFFAPDIAPVVRIASGTRIVVETEDALVGSIQKPEDGYANIGEAFAKLGGVNPVTGPIFVEGAKVGGCLAVEIHRIIPAPVRGTGWTILMAGLGGLVSSYTLQESLRPRVVIAKVERDYTYFPAKGKQIAIPNSPFFGTIGVAPAQERRFTFNQGADFLGNIDVPDVKAGATVVLPVNVDGALFGIGDAHSVQGHGEISGAAIEIQADAELTLTAMSKEEAKFVGLPQINTAGTIGSVAALNGPSVSDCIRAAYVDLVRRMAMYYGFEVHDAYQLVTQIAEVVVGQVVDPLYSALVKIDRKYLE